MITRFLKIQKLGVFDGFAWPSDLHCFKKNNLIYGWNYSGKTTLSRAFRCLEQKRPHPDFDDAQVEVVRQNGAVLSLTAVATAPEIRVFNTDFVNDNVSFETGTAQPILILGEADIEKQTALKDKIAKRDGLAEAKATNSQKKGEIVAAIDRALSKYARNIKIQLAVPDYERPRFEPKVALCKDNPQDSLLSEEEYTENLGVWNSTNAKPTVELVTSSLRSVGDFVTVVTSILQRTVTNGKPIESLRQNPEIESWVKNGRTLHEGQEKCRFCGGLLPADLLDRLRGHFSTEYDDLMATVQTAINDIKAAREQKVTLPHRSDLYPELSARFAAGETRLAKAIAARTASLQVLSDALTAKQTKAFSCVAPPSAQEPAGELDQALAALNAVVSDHNARTAEFETKRKAAFVKLENHHAATFVQDEGYKARCEQVATLEREIKTASASLTELDDEIASLECEVSESTKGAGKLNSFLSAYFGNGDLRVDVSSDQRFRIVRRGAVAKNLSEGEKAAIAFAYFLTLVHSGRPALTETIVVVDDPVSSLDANHLFNTYALIKTQLSACKQLFISTHNFEFYNLIREWMAEEEGKRVNRPPGEWNHWAAFQLRRRDEGTTLVEPLPRELLRFKSEYHFLFSVLHRFNRNPGADFDCLLNLPNVVRRFMEAFGGIMIPTYSGLKPKMKRLFPNEVERERVWKFINHYSHTTTVIRSLTIPDTSECQAVVQSCLKAVRDWDGDYYADLESEIADPTSGDATEAFA